MKILILAVHYEVTGARYIADAFTRLGHQVMHYGREGRLKDAWGVDVPEKYIWKPDQLPITEKPDLVIVADTQSLDIDYQYFFFPRTPVIVWCNDNHVRNVRNFKAQHYFLAHKHGPAQAVVHDDETWLPCAFDPTVFTPSLIPWAEREYDVCLIGVMYPRRAKLVQMLRDAGFKVFAETGLVYDEYRDAYQNSRISLCVSAARDVAQRVFETAAMGCVVLSDPLLDIRDEATNHDLGLQGYFFYNTDDECVAIVRDLLTTDSAKAQIGAARMQAAVRERHTWDGRCKVVVDYYNKYLA